MTEHRIDYVEGAEIALAGIVLNMTKETEGARRLLRGCQPDAPLSLPHRALIRKSLGRIAHELQVCGLVLEGVGGDITLSGDDPEKLLDDWIAEMSNLKNVKDI